MTFVKLGKGVDNGVEYWAVQPLRGGTEAHAMRGIKVIDGDPVRVRMPNNDEYDATVVAGPTWAMFGSRPKIPSRLTSRG